MGIARRAAPLFVCRKWFHDVFGYVGIGFDFTRFFFPAEMGTGVGFGGRRLNRGGNETVHEETCIAIGMCFYCMMDRCNQ